MDAHENVAQVFIAYDNWLGKNGLEASPANAGLFAFEATYLGWGISDGRSEDDICAVLGGMRYLATTALTMAPE